MTGLRQTPCWGPPENKRGSNLSTSQELDAHHKWLIYKTELKREKKSESSALSCHSIQWDEASMGDFCYWETLLIKKHLMGGPKNKQEVQLKGLTSGESGTWSSWNLSLSWRQGKQIPPLDPASYCTVIPTASHRAVCSVVSSALSDPMDCSLPGSSGWSGLPGPPSRDLPEPGIEAMSLGFLVLSGFFTTVPSGKPNSLSSSPQIQHDAPFFSLVEMLFQPPETPTLLLSSRLSPQSLPNASLSHCTNCTCYMLHIYHFLLLSEHRPVIALFPCCSSSSGRWTPTGKFLIHLGPLTPAECWHTGAQECVWHEWENEGLFLTKQPPFQIVTSSLCFCPKQSRLCLPGI